VAERELGPMPDYCNPPVTEVVCGLLFKSIDQLLAPHFGSLWERYKPDYRTCREVAPLMPVIERFRETPEIKIETTDVPPLPRIWFIQEADNGIIQVQRDRFLHNWRKLKPEDEYPRYSQVINMFRSHLATFEKFLADSELPGVDPLQYEMTYVNHIPQGDGWGALDDIGKVFPDFCWRACEDRFLPRPGQVRWRTAFELPEKIGRLHMTVQNVLRRSDERPTIQLEFTVRGIPDDKSRDAMWSWFNTAREWIVRGFADVTGSEIQESVWRRKHEHVS
jgi:uncharacterized protein (TIGR04255 family)